MSSYCALSTPRISEAQAAGAVRRERALLGALLFSAALHLLGISGAADWLAERFHSDRTDHGPPLRAVLKPPPPPTYQASPQPPPPKPRPKPKPRPQPVTPAVPAAPAVAADTVLPVADAAGPDRPEPAPAPPPAPVPAPADEVPVPVEAVAAVPQPAPVAEPAPAPAPAAPRVPKRIDLIGTLFVGERNFMVGTGGFRLRHDGNRYEISVLGEPRGLARLFVNGEFTGVSRGAITPNGLQPSEYVEERGRPERREAATLDWEAGVIRFKDDKVVPIEPPVYDRLSVILQFYYRPPAANELALRVTGTRYVDTYAFKRGEDERLELKFGTIDAHVWRANFDEGDPRIEIWMSPEYSYLPLRVRIHAKKANGGRYATLTIDEIRVED